MSLRLLLADESPSIKKAFELALQDFDAEIKIVHEGNHVKEIFEQFKPDICFLDVLLSKLNGYETSKEVKSAKSSTPVVLMWSSFMELDQDKFKESKADDSLEKPFDSAELKAMVSKHVQTLKGNQISDFLVLDDEDESLDNGPVFPDLPDLPNESAEVNKVPALNDDILDFSATDDAPQNDFEIPEVPDVDNILNFETPSESNEVDEFQLKDLTEDAPLETSKTFATFESSVSLTEELPFETPDLPPIPPNDFTTSELDEVTNPLGEDLAPLGAVSTEEQPAPPIEQAVQPAESTSFDLNSQLSKEELKRLILSQSKDIIESVVWDVVPELAKEMIQKEIKRLTGSIKYDEDLR